MHDYTGEGPPMKRLIHFELRKIMRLRIWIAILICLIPMTLFFVHKYTDHVNGFLAIQMEQPKLTKSLEGPVDPVLYKLYAPTLKEEAAEYSSKGTVR